MKRLIFVLVVAVAAAAYLPATTATAEDWCWGDPTLSINGRAVHFQLGAPVSKTDLIHASGVTVIVPSNVSANLTGAGNENFPMSVTLLATGAPWSGVGPIPVTATGVIGLDGSVPTRFKVWQANTGAVLGETGGVGGVAMPLTVQVQ